MQALTVYLRIYGKAFRDALAAIGRNPWTLLLGIAVLLVRDYSGRLAAPFGFLGGIVATLLTAAVFSCYLYFLRDLVYGGRVSARQLQTSLGAYLWAIVNVYFVICIASLALGLALGRNPNAAALLYALWIVAAIALNALPEVIYQRQTHGGMQTIAASWDFLKQQWIPWFAANVPLLAALAALAAASSFVPLGDVVVGCAFHLAMVFRGNLFRALDGSSHRRRMFEQRVA
jgi:hypothetical protein